MKNLAVQDIKIASYAKRKMKEIMVVYNKWDLIEKETNTINKYLKELHYQMPFLQFAPVLFISAKTSRIHRIMETVAKIEEESEKRISTAELNRFMEKVIYAQTSLPIPVEGI